MSDSKFAETNETIAEGVTNGFQKIEDGAVGTYKKIEDGVVGAYKKVEDAFVDKFLTHEGESVEEAKKRLETEQSARAADGSSIGRASLEASREIGRASVEKSKNIGRQ